MEVIAGSEEVLRADEKTKGLFVEFQKSWMGAAVGAGVGLADVGMTGGGVVVGEGAVREVGREGEGGMTMIMQEFGTGTMEIEGILVQDTYSSSSSPVSVGTERDARVTFTI